jgi:hypothetical protein
MAYFILHSAIDGNRVAERRTYSEGRFAAFRIAWLVVNHVN